METKEVKTSHVCEGMRKAANNKNAMRIITIGGDTAICPFCGETIEVTSIE